MGEKLEVSAKTRAARPVNSKVTEAVLRFSGAPHKGETNPMVHAEEGLHGHAGVPEAFLFSTHIRLYR